MSKMLEGPSSTAHASDVSSLSDAHVGSGSVTPLSTMRSKCSIPYLWSPVPHLLDSNLAPSDEETILIDHAIGEAEANLAQLLEHEEDGILMQETILFIRRHCAILSLIRRIPTEIIQEFILWGAVGQPIDEMKEYRWQISYVSQRWRAVTLSLPSIWSELPTVWLRLEGPGYSRAMRQMACLTEILRRSGNGPLSVTIKEGNTKGGQYFPLVLDLVAKHSDRWETLSVSIPAFATVGLLNLQGRLPLLKTLYLDLRNGWQNANSTLPNVFKVAPLLRRVHISGSTPSRLMLPPSEHSQIVHYKHLYITQEHLARVASYSLLESLVISEMSNSLIFPAVTFPRLKKFEYSTNLQRSENNIFAALKVPALEELTIAFPCSDSSIIPRLVTMLFNTGPSPLRTLRINTGAMEPGELTILLDLTPALVSLDVSFPPHCDIEALASQSSSGEFRIVPQLQSCKFMSRSCWTDFCSETRDLLNFYARVRCEGRQDPMKFLVYSTSLGVQDTIWSRDMQRQLNGFAPVGRTGARLVELNQLLRSKLLPPENRDEKQLKLSEIINIIEDIKVRNVEDIFVSGIHLTLRHLIERRKRVISSRVVLYRHMDALLARWDLLMRSQLQGIHWCCEGPYSVTYISNHDALRTSSNALDIVYGLKCEMSIDEADWSSSLGIPGKSALYWPRPVEYFE